MQLTVTASNYRLIRAGQLISMSNNGSELVRIYDASFLRIICMLHHSKVTWHMTDADTSFTITGFAQVNAESNQYEQIRLELQ